MEKEKIKLDLYHQGKSDGFIAKELGFKCAESIRYWRIKNNLPANDRFDFNITEAIRLKDEGKRYKEIAQILNTTQSRVNGYFLRRTGTLSSKERGSKNIELTKEQKEIIFGGLLGDSSGRIPDNAINASIKFEQGYKQKEYLEYKYNLLKNLAISIKKQNRIDKRFNRIYESYFFYLKTNPALNEFIKMFYLNKIKFVPKDLSLLTPLAIAIWFMDDGSKTGSGYRLSTNSFTKEDNNRLQRYLYNEYNIESNLDKSNVIYIKANSRKIFTNLIKSFIIESMQYKMHVPLKFCELLENPEEDNQQPSILEIK